MGCGEYLTATPLSIASGGGLKEISDGNAFVYGILVWGDGNI